MAELLVDIPVFLLTFRAAIRVPAFSTPLELLEAQRVFRRRTGYAHEGVLDISRCLDVPERIGYSLYSYILQLRCVVVSSIKFARREIISLFHL